MTNDFKRSEWIVNNKGTNYVSLRKNKKVVNSDSARILSCITIDGNHGRRLCITIASGVIEHTVNDSNYF